MAVPAGLSVVVHLPGESGAGGPVVVLVHGALDRGDSFRRVVRRLEDATVVTYDRRGYQRSRGLGPAAGLDDHAADLLALADEIGEGRPVVAVGHSLGGDVVLAAALDRPTAFSSLGVFEPPMPWLPLPLNEGRPFLPDDPAVEAERFFRRVVGEAAWERLPDSSRLDRRADGPALVADLRSINSGPPFDPTALTLPLLVGVSGRVQARPEAAVDWLVGHVPGAGRYEIPGATHGAHLSHPDAFAGFVRAVVLRAIGPTLAWATAGGAGVTSPEPPGGER